VSSPDKDTPGSGREVLALNFGTGGKLVLEARAGLRRETGIGDGGGSIGAGAASIIDLLSSTPANIVG
jgi:hypothetical protein